MKEKNNRREKINEFGEKKCHRLIGKQPITVWEYLISRKSFTVKTMKPKGY